LQTTEEEKLPIELLFLPNEEDTGYHNRKLPKEDGLLTERVMNYKTKPLI
jgi:hypothetical protein